MSYLIGATAMLFFSFALTGIFYAGYRLGQRKKPLVVDEDKQREIERKNKSFEAILNYDINTAMGKRK